MSFFTDTLFGLIARKVSGGRLFPYRDSWDEDLRHGYLNGPVKSDESDGSDNEKKSEYKLIEFREGDEDVSYWQIVHCKQRLTKSRTRRTGR